MRILKFLLRSLCISALVITITGCTASRESGLEKAQSEFRLKRYDQALKIVEEKVFDPAGGEPSEEAAKLGLDISENYLKDYTTALKFSRFLSFSSKNNEDQIFYLIKSCELLFDKLNRYSEAIPAIQRALFSIKDKDALMNLRIKLIRSFHFIGEYENALTEIKVALDSQPTSEQYFQIMQLNGHIHQARHEFDKATEIFLGLVNKYPKESLRDNIQMALAINYEESFQIDKAIQTLQSIEKEHEVPEFIRLRIERLQKKASNSPGFRGLKK